MIKVFSENKVNTEIFIKCLQRNSRYSNTWLVQISIHRTESIQIVSRWTGYDIVSLAFFAIFRFLGNHVFSHANPTWNNLYITSYYVEIENVKSNSLNLNILEIFDVRFKKRNKNVEASPYQNRLKKVGEYRIAGNDVLTKNNYNRTNGIKRKKRVLLCQGKHKGDGTRK